MSEHKDNRFVAHFDMLGMGALTKRNPDLAWDKLSALSQARDEHLSQSIQRLDTDEVITDQLHTFTFSDTVIAFSKCSSENDALAIVLLTTNLFAKALHYCIPLRGCIAHGRFAFNLDLNLFSGPALIDAYELGESSQWLGVVLDQHTTNIVSRLPVGKSERNRDIFVPWDVPCKDGIIRRRKVVNWPETHRHNYIGPVPLAAEDFYAPFEPLFGPYEELHPSVAMKYANTAEFFNAHY